jgi:hypothetical protein
MLDRCNGLRCSLRKNALRVGFILARSCSHALTALSSSPRSGCVVDSPAFNRDTCNTRLSVSTGSSFIRQASATRSPCRNISSNKQRSLASFRPPGRLDQPSNLAAREVGRSHSSRPVLPPLRPFIILSRVSPCGVPETRVNRARGCLTMNKMVHFVERTAGAKRRAKNMISITSSARVISSRIDICERCFLLLPFATRGQIARAGERGKI